MKYNWEDLTVGPGRHWFNFDSNWLFTLICECKQLPSRITDSSSMGLHEKREEEEEEEAEEEAAAAMYL